MPSLLAMGGGYPGLRSPNRDQVGPRAVSEASSPKGPPPPASLRSGASPSRENVGALSPSSLKTPSAANRSAASPNREASSNFATSGVPNASGGNLSNSAASVGMMGCSPSAPSAAQAKSGAGNGNAKDPHSMSFRQKQQLFASAKAKPADNRDAQRQTLRDRAAAATFQQQGLRADSAPTGRSMGVALKQDKSVTAARVVAPGGVRAVAAKFTPQEQTSQQPLSAARSQSSAAPTSPGNGVAYGGVSGMAPRAGMQAQRSRATVPAVRSTPVGTTPGPGSPTQAPPASANSARATNTMILNTARGRSSSPAYLVAEQHPGSHPGSMPTTARSSARIH